ncbi:MAG: TIGR01440 family protein [Oscillospiraceae bacterium]|nr:TIGR01440 family protein [Oscillospiraceae bacterium]
MQLQKIQTETTQAVQALLAEANLRPGDLFVVGCSTSEVAGEHIGRAGSLEIAAAIFDGLYPALQAGGIALAVQCCEHLNRALVVECATAERAGLEIVSAVPYPEAGGAFAAVAWNRFSDPVLAERIEARAGMDIGGTLIGMHLAPVAVPVRLPIRSIGKAHLICARSRPKRIGGQRTKYI